MLLRNINPFLRYAQRFYYDRVSITKCPADARIFYFVSGTGRIIVEGTSYPIAPGTLALINAGFVYRMELDSGLEMIAFNFDYNFDRSDITMFFDPCPQEMAEELRQEPIEDCPALSAPLILQGMFHMQNQLDEIINVFQTQKLYYQEEVSSLLKSLLIHLARSTLLSKTKTSGIANQLIYYLQEHYREDLTSTRIAAEFNYHAYHINRIMRSATGTTVHNYLINYRIAVSKNLLSNSTKSIEEIAAEVGFQSTPYFSNSFKRVVGCSPTYYRMAHLENIKKIDPSL